MGIGNHPELIILHILNKELENVLNGNIVLSFRSNKIG